MDIGTAPQPWLSDAPWAALEAKFSRYLALSDAERDCLASWQAPARVMPRRRDLVREGNDVACVYLLCRGIVSRYRVLPDGRRQILGFGLPGDVIGFPSCSLARAAASVCCITESEVAAIPLEQFASTLTRFPRIAAALFWIAARETALAQERLVTLGRRGAEERVAYFFLELCALLHKGRPRDGERIAFPLTQEIIADTLGLSTPHANRTLRRLRDQRLLALDGQEAILLDARGLIALASFDPAHFAAMPIPGL